MLGFGLGLRTKHYNFVLENRPKVDWFEVISENFMNGGGKPRRILREIRKDYPVILHGVSLSVGSKDPLNKDYLRLLKELVLEMDPPWFSDHLCWTSIGGHYSHDLLPLPYSRETLRHVCERIGFVQDFVGRQMLIENVSSYVSFKSSTMSEWEFLSEIVKKTGCKLLFDVNNIYVSGKNHGFDALEFINGIPQDAVKQFHLAGHTDNGDHLIDTHDHPVCDPVWKLFEAACRRFGPIPTMIERDENIPEFPELLKELGIAKKLHKKSLENETDGKTKSKSNSKSILESPRFL